MLATETGVVRRNGTLVVSNRYDHLGRRVQKIAMDGTHTFLYDGWRPVVETVARASGGTDRIEYFWGKDLSGSLDGAAGVGGLLYVKRNGAVYVPFYDAFGNVMGYWDELGNVVAEYAYDAFGRTVAKSGIMTDMFSIRYSTKYYDAETGMYYYGKRFYVTSLCRWLTRDPIEEDGGVNLYLNCCNNQLSNIDPMGTQQCEVNAFFKGALAEYPIDHYVEVHSREITHINVLRDFFSWIPWRKELSKYLCVVDFVPRFRPPEKIPGLPYSDNGRNALGGFMQAYTPLKGQAAMPSSYWGLKNVESEKFSWAGVLLERKISYPNKKFRFGCFVYVAESASSPFVLVESNDDMFNTWYFGHPNILSKEDRCFSRQRDYCEIIEVQYGDKGTMPHKIRFSGRSKK